MSRIFSAAIVFLATSALSQSAEAPPSALADIERVDQLKTIFNADAGKTRIILLLSPT